MPWILTGDGLGRLQRCRRVIDCGPELLGVFIERQSLKVTIEFLFGADLVTARQEAGEGAKRAR